MQFLHIRNFDSSEQAEQLYTTKGGKTVAYEQEGNQIRYALAVCSPRDNYCRKTGRAIATGRFEKGVTVVSLDFDPNTHSPVSRLLEALS